MSGPLLVIVLRLEAPPQVYVDAADEWEASRLRDWIDHAPGLADLRDHALELRETWKRREYREGHT